MGYDVRLIKGEVIIKASALEHALAAVRDLDRRDELKTGWSRIDLPGRNVGLRPHWAFTIPEEIASAQSLVEMLRAFRFEVDTEPDGEIYGVELAGGTRSAGDEAQLWRALAPYVEPGGEMIWLGEDDRLQRWSFDGRAMATAKGRMVFDGD